MATQLQLTNISHIIYIRNLFHVGEYLVKLEVQTVPEVCPVENTTDILLKIFGTTGLLSVPMKCR